MIFQLYIDTNVIPVGQSYEVTQPTRFSFEKSGFQVLSYEVSNYTPFNKAF